SARNSQHDKRDVVARLPTVELVELALDRLDDDLGARPRARREHLREPILAEEPFRAPGVDDAVRVEDQRVSGDEPNHAIVRCELGKRAEHATAGGNALDLAAGAQDERRRVAGTRDDQAGTVAVPPETDVRGGAEPLVAVTAHDFVHEIEDEARTSRLDDGGARRVADERGERGRLRTLPADGPHHDRPVVAGALEDVVEVASDVAPGPRRFVVRRDLDAGDGGKVRRKQALLERFGQLRQAGAAGSQLTFGLGPFDELADL